VGVVTAADLKGLNQLEREQRLFGVGTRWMATFDHPGW
jgi:hypothetical protein